MDTSNSKNTVSPVAVILGDQQFEFEQASLSVDDWVLILDKTLGKLKPRFKYLHGFTELKDHLNQKNEDWHCPYSMLADMSDGHVVKITAPSVSAKTRIVEVCSLPKIFNDKLELPKHSRGLNLCLTQSGDLLSLYVHYVRVGWLPGGKIPKYVAKDIQVKQVVFSELPLTQKHNALHTVAGNILNHLYAILELTVKIRQEHLDEMEGSLVEIQSIRDHIQFCSGSMLSGRLIT